MLSGGRGERVAYKPPGRSKALPAPSEGSAESVRRSGAGTGCPKKSPDPVGRGRVLIDKIRSRPKDDGFDVSISNFTSR